MLIDDCRKSGIAVLPPDVNESSLDFTVVHGTIRFGLGAIKGVGESAVEGIIVGRKTGGPFRNLFDFCSVQAGAFDTMGGHRAQHFESIEGAAAYGLRRQDDELSGQTGLFDPVDRAQAGAAIHPALAETVPWSELDKLQREKGVLGFYVSGHPLLRYEQEVKEFSTVPLGILPPLSRAPRSVRAGS